jgi:hypothetical protein|tara:strand:+ start:214 stop:1044 length:831 start_codon:yes stop_codon:yes gene_type:complete
MQTVNNYWKILEKNLRPPKHLRQVKILTYKNFNKIIVQKNLRLIKKIIKDLYLGDVYIIRNSIPPSFLENLKNKLLNWSKKEKSKFHKINKKCPNFWRNIDKKNSKKYSINSLRKTYYFFRWNKSPIKVWEKFNKPWGYVKFLGGLKYNSFIKNTPKNGVIDRIQIVNYPINTGYIAPHQHNPKHQRVLISLYMSQIKKHFSKGGTYFYKKKKKINIENKIKPGDLGLFYATMIHGVDEVKSVKENNEGRWWVGLYSPESNITKTRRTTSNPVILN